MRPLIAILCWTIFFYGTPVLAEPADAGDLDARIADLKAQRSQIRRGWPTDGVVAGSILTAAGISTLVLTHWTCDDGEWFDNGPDQTNCAGGSVDGQWAAGGILVGGGLILVGASGWTLAKRNRERRALGRQIRDLENARAARIAPSFALGFELGDRTGLRLAWRY